jgi:uncharacterized protein (TIGR02001 family)
MKKFTLSILAAIMFSVLLFTPATAEESSPHSLSGWLAFGTDYYYRGATTTDNDPAIQAEIDYEHSSGLYAGIWGSNIAGDSTYWDADDEEYTEDGNLEIDVWVGYWREIGPIELDLMAMYLYYPNNVDAGNDSWDKNSAEADYWEFHIGLAHKFNLPTVPKLHLEFDYSPDYWGEDGTSYHVNAILELGLPFEVQLALEAGYQNVDGDKQTGRDNGDGVDGGNGFDYNYYRVGLSRDIFVLNCDLSYHFGNSEEDWFKDSYETSAEDKLILTVSYAF